MKKIGVLGTMNSGKTVLLTSLLCHLDDFSRDRFPIGKSDTRIQNFNLCESHKYPERDFKYNAYKNKFIEHDSWPMKTQDFAIARCTYLRTDSFWGRDVSFVDIPGERVSDVLIYRADDYEEWSRQIEKFWSGDERIQACMDGFMECRQQLEKSLNSESECWSALVDEYRKGLIALARNHSPFITPSTFVLTTEGKTMAGLSIEEIADRPIWSEGAFFPLPNMWRESKNKVLNDIYAKCEKTFTKYRKEVLKPLYDEIDDCDSFIVCVDVFNILVSGLSRFYQVKGEISNFFQMIRPSKFTELLLDIQKAMDSIKVGGILPNFLKMKPPKIAYVATKSDMAIPSEGKDNLYMLLEDLIRNVNNFSYVNSKLFTCCAGRTFDYDPDLDKVVIFTSKGEKRVPLDEWPKLPSSWAKWDPVNYRRFLEIGCPMQLTAGMPPQQDNLDKLFDFITEDDD